MRLAATVVMILSFSLPVWADRPADSGERDQVVELLRQGDDASRRGMPELARTLYEAVLTIDPKNPAARLHLADSGGEIVRKQYVEYRRASFPRIGTPGQAEAMQMLRFNAYMHSALLPPISPMLGPSR